MAGMVYAEGHEHPAGSWDIWYSDIAIVSLNGTVTSLFGSSGAAGINATECQGPGTAGIEIQSASTAPGIVGSGADTHFYLADHLGTAQLEFSSGGWPIWEGEFAPYGQQLQNGVPLAPDQTDASINHYKFTGKERDAESGLDYFGARYYSSSMGRFSSPDPSGLVFADPTNPQGLNLYSYVLNNPLRLVDPTGMAYCQWDDDGTHDDSANTGVDGAVNSGTECTNAGGSWSHADGLNDDGSQMGSEQSPSLTVTATLNTSTNSTSVSTTGVAYDPDGANLYNLIQGIATDTAGFPTVCSVGGSAQVGGGPVAAGYSYDSNSGGKGYGTFRATPANPGSFPSITQGNMPGGSASPFSATVKVDTNGKYSGGVTVRDPYTGVGGGVSVNEKGTPTVSASVRKGPVTVGATATLGTIGNPKCQPHR